MAIVFSNNARTTLASNISNSATTITVADGSVFPSMVLYSDLNLTELRIDWEQMNLLVLD